ncbi:hypothetical protein IB244_30845 [Rhizobium sp. RHZ02]|uniref:hypothetical protein n=1 Tax=Rhizobium sp. RHZ02 TaxID=2769306 RepID=UPI0017830F42|nr:hypothetical protein [Rhizobium sp. RHZ02]MBD9455876.1 hypothetical protein [Rhizobium sp. RHZ02]
MEEPKIGVNTGNRGKGRPKGAKNKTTALLKDAILKAAEEAGGKDGIVGYLKAQAGANPGPFMALLGKVLPTQLEGNLTFTHEDALNELE